MIYDSLYKILPQAITNVICKRLNPDRVYELRLRTNKPVMINYGGNFYYLSNGGVKDSVSNSIICAEGVISDIVVKASEYSLYAVNDNICNGYITIKGGVRLGLAGEIVWEQDQIRTIKNFSSLNIRVPHEIFGCAQKVYDYACAKELKNTLVISPPGAGKTTLLRDLSRIIGNSDPATNILLVDERNELAAVHNGVAQLDIGYHTDVISNCSKQFAFSQGIRAMRPDIIVTDELFGDKDVSAIEYACASGVCVIASVHAADHADLINKPGFENIIKKRLFRRFVNLSSRHGPGTFDGIYDENFNCIYYS